MEGRKKNARAYQAVIVVLVIIIGALLALSSGIISGAGADTAKAEQGVKDIYKLATNSDIEILKTAEESGLYKISVKFKNPAGQDTLQDVYVTKDGALFTDRVLDLQLQKSLLQNQSAFARCLIEKNVRIIGLTTDADTQAQLQLFGPYGLQIYVDCGGQNAAVCQQLGIQQLPIIFNNGTLVQGPVNVQWFGENAECYMSSTGTAP